MRVEDWVSGRRFRVVCGVCLGISVLVAAAASLRWPLVGDASLMHYIVFLQRMGAVPYRDIVDINLPGTYFFEALAMRCFGDGAPGWRLYDLFLLVCCAGAAWKLAGRARWFAAMFSGSLFALVHLQDGIAQGGQRDLLMAALLLWAYVALFAAEREEAERPVLLMLLFGLSVGATLTIKPVLLPLGLALLLIAGRQAWLRQRAFATLCAGFVGLAIPTVAMLLWLRQVGGLSSFMRLATGLVVLHARMGRQTLPYLLSHCFSPIAALVALWVLMLLIERHALSVERIELAIGIAGTALAYIAQGKGFPYQRYPLLAILLVVVATDLDRLLHHPGRLRWAAVATCVLGCLVLAPRYAYRATTFSPTTPFEDALAAGLAKFGEPAKLSGGVQCLDTFGGCINTLFNLRVPQSTGFLYDCYLFAEPSEERERYRAAFRDAYEGAHPNIVIETNQFCFGDPKGYGKLTTWPALASELDREYELNSAWRSEVPQHWWSRKEQPPEFRIYVRRAR